MQKEPNLTFSTLKNDLQSDSTKSIFRYVIYVTQKKPHAKKEEKLLKRFRDRPLPPSILTDRQTDGQTDRQTDRRTTDKSVIEKLRCLSAGGAKKSIFQLRCAIWQRSFSNADLSVVVGVVVNFKGGGGGLPISETLK